MLVDLVIPEVGESIHEVQVLKWHKQPGDSVSKEEEIVEIETEKATVPIAAPAAGKLAEVLKKEGDFAEVGEILARIETAADATASSPAPVEPKPKPKKLPPVEAPPAESPPADEKPAAPPSPQTSAAPPKEKQSPPAKIARSAPAAEASGRQEQRVPMSLLRRTIARRLVEAQRNAALVTTYNEVDMQEVIDLRRDYGQTFQEAFDIKLGFMSFFVKAAVEGLKRSPEINAQIAGDDIVYKSYYDIGVAIGSGRGLVVPVLRDCQRLSFADIEHQIAQFARKAADGKLTPGELEGGTFTISNGGIYGSLLSTPIVNPPQSGVLGLHAIQDRPVAKAGQVVIRPMMYIALTYDHRLVDGREAVTFLRRIKEVVETPSRLFLEI